MNFQGRDLDCVSNYSLPFPSAFVWFPWGLRKDDQSLQVGEGEAGTELSLQTGWWLRPSTVPPSRFLSPHPHPRRHVRQVEGGLTKGRGSEMPQNAPPCLLSHQGQLLLAGLTVLTSSASLCVLGSNGNAFLKNAQQYQALVSAQLSGLPETPHTHHLLSAAQAHTR